MWRVVVPSPHVRGEHLSGRNFIPANNAQHGGERHLQRSGCERRRQLLDRHLCSEQRAKRLFEHRRFRKHIGGSACGCSNNHRPSCCRVYKWRRIRALRGRHDHRPEAGLYMLAPQIARQSSLFALGTFQERHGDQLVIAPAGEGEPAIWGRVFGEKLTLTNQFSSYAQFSYTTNLSGQYVQAIHGTIGIRYSW